MYEIKNESNKNMKQFLFKDGDVVKLKSGGHKMVIVEGLNIEYPSYVCVWFDIYKQVTHYQFEEFLLKKVK
jgi:uncharacterized protein YodC (DUF2158 family)